MDKVASKALRELKPEDRVSVMAFNRGVFFASPFTSDRGTIEADLGELLGKRFGGGTRIQSAVDEAANDFWVSARKDAAAPFWC